MDQSRMPLCRQALRHGYHAEAADRCYRCGRRLADRHLLQQGGARLCRGPGSAKLNTDRHAAPSSVLLDPDGKLGHLYGATTTPHMFIIDKAGTLVYMGGIDDKPSTAPETVKTARPYVREALDALAEGKPIQVAST